MTKVRGRFDLSKDYGLWLSNFQWDYYATLTTKYKLTLPAARRAVEGLHKELLKAGYSLIFFAIEPYDLKEGYHIHALMKVPKGYKYPHILQIWQHVSGNKRKVKEGNDGSGVSTWNRIQLQTYNPKLGGSHYVGKYIMKERADYDLLV
jgi:hypothetical protein